MKTVGIKTTLGKTSWGLAMLGVTSLSGVVGAGAVPVSPGAPQTLSGTTVAARPELAGTVLEDRVREFSFTNSSGATIRGTFQDRVVKRTSSGLLEFSFRIKNDSTSAGNIVVVNRQNYSGFAPVDVDYRLDGLGTVGASSAAHGGGANARIKFDFFASPILPGKESRFHFIGTNATSYNENGKVGLQSNNGGYTTFKVFSPNLPPRRPRAKIKLK